MTQLQVIPSFVKGACCQLARRSPNVVPNSRCRPRVAVRGPSLMGASAASLVSIAFHEAGHAVAAWHRGPKIHRATTIPTPGPLGHVKEACPQRRHRASDHERAVDLAMRVNSSDRAVEAYLAWLTIVASDDLVERHALSQAEIAACCAARTALAASGHAETATIAKQPPAPFSEAPGGPSDD